MKDNLFEILLTLFEKTLTHLKEAQEPTMITEDLGFVGVKDQSKGLELEFLHAVNPQSVRVFTAAEQLKFTKASYQFLIQFFSTQMVHSATMELIINRLLFSESRFVSLQETKWMIRHTLAETLNHDQLAFLELVLYQKEDRLALH